MSFFKCAWKTHDYRPYFESQRDLGMNIQLRARQLRHMLTLLMTSSGVLWSSLISFTQSARQMSTDQMSKSHRKQTGGHKGGQLSCSQSIYYLLVQNDRCAHKGTRSKNTRRNNRRPGEGRSSPPSERIRTKDTLHIHVPQFVSLQNGTHFLAIWLLGMY